MNINQHIYNANQFQNIEICINVKYAILLAINRKVCAYFVARIKSFKIERRDM